ncbi:MAG: (Fe-S)-binding protein [Ignavibacteriales bacterium]|nr:(Fe-S)-binding protein [Ignavibacteriales bacterium]
MADRTVPDYDILVHCIHCGLCLPHCPTYVATGNERSSPRGRIRLMKSVSDGVLPLSDLFVEEMDFCLDCQACETACPAGVKYGALVEAARAQIYEEKKERWLRRLTKRFFLGWVLMKRTRIHLLAKVLRWYDRTGIPHALSESGAVGLISARLDSLLKFVPKISGRFSSDELGPILMPVGEDTRYKVGFLTGCVMDVAYAAINEDTVEVLRRHGCQVVVPCDQVCCGSLHAHNGDYANADALAKINIQAFADDSLDFIVMNSAGCGAFMKEYGHRFAHDPFLAEQARKVSAKVRDITEFLGEAGFHPSTQPARILKGKTISYHDACHLVHTQKVYRQPRDLLRSVPGILYKELPESTWCCGSAGIYNIVRHGDSLTFLERKLQNIRSIAPDILVMGNPGCMIQIAFGLERDKSATSVMHTSTFLRHACCSEV